MEEEKIEAGNKVVKPLYVKVFCRRKWEVSYHGKGKRVYPAGSEALLNIRDKYELSALLSMLKIINSRTNKVTHVITTTSPHDYEKASKYEIIEGKENIPKALIGYSYGLNNWDTPEEKAAIRSLCPDYDLRGAKDPATK